MKFSKLAVLIALVLAQPAFAGDDSKNQGASAYAGAAASAKAYASGGSALGIGGNASSAGGASSINVEDRLQIPVASSAIAPSVSQHDKCPWVSPESSGFSVFLFSVSQTKGVSYNALCIAEGLGQRDVVQQMLCDSSETYRKAAVKVSASAGVSNYCK